nr:GntR family transcriptional regulator [Brevibacterium marinum]
MWQYGELSVDEEPWRGVRELVSVREIDPSSGVPFYRQIKDILRTEISDGVVDEKTPITEALLLERFDVSRAPIRQALQELADEGYVYRMQGKGTFPIPGEVVHRPADIRPGAFQDYLIDRGLHPTSEVTGLERAVPPEEVQRLLGSAESESLLHFHRRIFVDGKPLSGNEVYIQVPADFVTTVEELEQERSVFNILESRYGITVARAENEASATQAVQGPADTLEIGLGEPVLLIDSVFYDRGGNALGWRSAIHRPTDFKFHFVTGR